MSFDKLERRSGGNYHPHYDACLKLRQGSCILLLSAAVAEQLKKDIGVERLWGEHFNIYVDREDNSIALDHQPIDGQYLITEIQSNRHGIQYVEFKDLVPKGEKSLMMFLADDPGEFSIVFDVGVVEDE